MENKAGKAAFKDLGQIKGSWEQASNDGSVAYPYYPYRCLPRLLLLPRLFLFQFKPFCGLCSEFVTLLSINSSHWCCLLPSYCLELAGPLSLLQYPKKIRRKMVYPAPPGAPARCR